ncbi:MAG: hypothetical protein V4612_00910 [Pseudomonadota bacterium]
MRLIKIFFTITFLTATTSCHYYKVIISNPDQSTKESIIAEKQYVMGTDDVPLFSGLELIGEDSSSFDTMLGNIVISKYIGDTKLKFVKDFYLAALPQLGWKLIDDQSDQISFKREDDKLEIRFSYASKGLYVRFFISSVIK